MKVKLILAGMLGFIASGMIGLAYSPIALSRPAASTQVDHTFTIDTLYDNTDGSANDTSPGNQICATYYDGKCSLRAAIMEANALSGITTLKFNLTYPATIQLIGELPNISGSVIINGPGVDNLTLDGNSLYRHFNIASSGSLSINNLFFWKGGGAQNGGSLLNAGQLTVKSVTFYLNNSPQTGLLPASGGAIKNNGMLTVTTSTFLYNTAGYGGAISNDGKMLLSDSTFSNNSATSSGGAIHTAGSMIRSSTFLLNNTNGFGSAIFVFTDTLVLINSTIAANTTPLPGAYTGGAVSTGDILGHGHLAINSSTFYGNYGGAIYSWSAALTNTLVAGSDPADNCALAVGNGGHNLDDKASCGWSSTTGSISNANPMLNPLLYNGGSTQSMALQPNSPAINAGDNAACAALGNVDQRGFKRINPCDIGAYEVSLPTFLPLTLKNH